MAPKRQTTYEVPTSKKGKVIAVQLHPKREGHPTLWLWKL